MTGVQGDRQERHDLTQAEQTKRQRILRELIDLPTHHDQLHLRRHDHRQNADHEPAE